MPILREAWEKAFRDRQAGAFRRHHHLQSPASTEALAKAISEIFSEVIIAPEFETEARALAPEEEKPAPDARLSRPHAVRTKTQHDIRSVAGGAARQDTDVGPEMAISRPKSSASASADHGTKSAAMIFGWRVVKHGEVERDRLRRVPIAPLGIGAGQMSRVDASRIAVWKANEAGLSLRRSAVASDAFFPFPDGLIAAAGCRRHLRDPARRFSPRRRSVIAAANERGIADDLYRRPALPALSAAGARELKGYRLTRRTIEEKLP